MSNLFTRAFPETKQQQEYSHLRGFFKYVEKNIQQKPTLRFYSISFDEFKDSDRLYDLENQPIQEIAQINPSDLLEDSDAYILVNRLRSLGFDIYIKTDLTANNGHLEGSEIGFWLVARENNRALAS